jgi:hypothetical protein
MTRTIRAVAAVEGSTALAAGIVAFQVAASFAGQWHLLRPILSQGAASKSFREFLTRYLVMEALWVAVTLMGGIAAGELWRLRRAGVYASVGVTLVYVVVTLAWALGVLGFPPLQL